VPASTQRSGVLNSRSGAVVPNTVSGQKRASIPSTPIGLWLANSLRPRSINAGRCC